MEGTVRRDRDSLSLSCGSPTTRRVGFGSGLYPAEKNPEGHDDDYIAELTRQMADYMFRDDNKNKSRGGSGSPQSTLWSPFGAGYGSPIGPSREPSPPLVPAVETFGKMKGKDEITPIGIPFSSRQALIEEQIRSAQANFRKMKEKGEKERVRPRRRSDGVAGKGNRARDTPVETQRTGSGTKAMFLNGSGSKPGSGGTGVFLPRGTSSVVESRKKTGGTRVIIPARVVEALKDHFDKLGHPSNFTCDFSPHHDALLVPSSSTTKGRKGHSYAAAAAVSATIHRKPPAADLPPEWTY